MQKHHNILQINKTRRTFRNQGFHKSSNKVFMLVIMLIVLIVVVLIAVLVTDNVDQAVGSDNIINQKFIQSSH